MKRLLPFAALTLIATPVRAAEPPETFKGMLEPGIPVKGEVGMVLPPKEIDKFIGKVDAAARKDPKWFREYSSQSKPGLPLPYDERLGLTKEEYDEYLALWGKRQFKAMEEVMMMLRPGDEGSWTLTCTGKASMLSTLRYDPKADVFHSPNGDLKRIEDIKPDVNSILGEWSGREWKFEEETTLGKTKENVAVGKFAGNKYGLIVYRMQELSSEGTRLLDKSLVLRFPLGKAAAAAAPAPEKDAKAPAIKETAPAKGATSKKK